MSELLARESPSLQSGEYVKRSTFPIQRIRDRAPDELRSFTFARPIVDLLHE